MAAAALVLMCPGCSRDDVVLHDGYYSAVAASFNALGWKDFVTLYVYNNRIVTVEFNARNPSGLIMSWDGMTLRRLKRRMAMHPNSAIRHYTQELLSRQNPDSLRRVAGDDYFYDTFKLLTEAAIAQAKTGNKSVVNVPLGDTAPQSR